ncbi:MAG: hypothetical protein ACKOGA_21750 [Planctomycetaceae bacterium]
MTACSPPSASLARRSVAWLKLAGWLCAGVVGCQLLVLGTSTVVARPRAVQPPPQAETAPQPAPAATPDPNSTPSQRAQIEALQPWAGLVGQWRGVGQPTRGSNKGAWSETANWQWDLADNGASLKLVVAEGKQLTGGHLRWLATDKQFEFSAQLPGGSKQTFRGVRTENKLVLDALPEQAEAPLQRVVVTQLSDNRALLLFQSKGPRQTAHQRIAEVGYTRAGTRLAREGADSPVCVVTGGRGTIEVQFEGQTYFVCCTGCQDAFEEDPKAIIAAFKERQAAEKAPKPR